MALKPQAVELHIEELVLHGFAPGDRLSIGDSVQRELSRLIAERGLHGLAGGSLAIERLDGGAFQVAPGSRPGTIGTQLAGAIHRQFAPAAKMGAKPSRSGA
ncbi:conserved hypothetical protein [Candidatus Sulfopaludibacter sp. SbA3]|nr:conserved hypothetical protein [Candidatus Sulfopaludibacter sp. SbA3]